MFKVVCPQHGMQHADPIAPVGPSLTRPLLRIIERIKWTGRLYDANPDCDHYVYMKWSGVACARCPGWYCA